MLVLIRPISSILRDASRRFPDRRRFRFRLRERDERHGGSAGAAGRRECEGRATSLSMNPAAPDPSGACVRFMFGTRTAQTLAAGLGGSCARDSADNNGHAESAVALRCARTTESAAPLRYATDFDELSRVA